MPDLQFILISEHFFQMRKQTIHHILILIIPFLPEHLRNIDKPILPNEWMKNRRLKKNEGRFVWKLMGESKIEFKFAILIEALPDKNDAVPYYPYIEQKYPCSCRDWVWHRCRAGTHTSVTSYYKITSIRTIRRGWQFVVITHRIFCACCSLPPDPAVPYSPYCSLLNS